MKKIIFLSCVLIPGLGWAQQIKTETPLIDGAFAVAVKTIDDNTESNLIEAGADYGGEWTRDISINSWNACSLLRPVAAEYSMWSVTRDNRSKIGHQYWDQIIWVPAAYNHYLINGDKEFLKEAFICSANTMDELENKAFDSIYGLFTGPSVFNDGIAGYEEPIFDPKNNSSYVLDFPAAKKIKCLSTNCIYYEAYLRLADMAELLGNESAEKIYKKKAAALKDNIRKYLYDKKNNKLNYLIDADGNVHHFQEGLGLSFAILSGVVSKKEARSIIEKAHISNYGIPSVYPDFKRYSTEKPGRHNNLVWPFVNAFWADACFKSGKSEGFMKEFVSLTELAMIKSKHSFWEIYNPVTGNPDGGWQVGRHWPSCREQTWSATGYLRMVFNDLLGMSFSEEGLGISPAFDLLNQIGFKELTGIPYRNNTISVIFNGCGDKPKGVYVNGKKMKKAFIPADISKPVTVTYEF
ncbi:MGH1-like glycoside hydrolase domain-containing protein [Coprobacter tertius]|uniref:Mannosylglycerate hydrolase MGH1-like glycoside hydrolase domain-containing protein n=1 Tax=Coprobacter tertius TaxID=2944915 RepID=A0ABT1MGV0_9BACT|nr:hypothetical protein [Coprobacter tertius]MCP9611857.1 hypothetical protein [Coprobacter tertius]